MGLGYNLLLLYGQYFYKSKEFDAFVTIKTIDTSARIKDVFNEFEKKTQFYVL